METDASHARYLRTPRFPSLDGLRCLAIVPVFWHHCTTGPLPGILGKGPLGVDLFFALSGFLITTLLLRERDANGGISARGFYSRRALRIFPLYYGVLGLYALRAWLWMPEGPQRAHFLASLPYFATYTTNWFVDFAVPHPVSFAFSWSLASEEQFYLLWPWVLGAAFLASRRGATWRWLLPAVVSLALLALDQGVAHGLLSHALPAGTLARRMARSVASPICMGALLALALHAPRGFALLRVLLGLRGSAAAVFAAVVACVWLDGVPLWLAQLALTFLVGACAVRSDHSLVWLTDGAPVRWVGTVSYGIYLFHVALITGARLLVPAALGTPGWAFAIGLPVTVAVASASYVWLERPLLGLRAKLGARSSPAADDLHPRGTKLRSS